MNNVPTVSVITPMHNAEKYIPSTITSVLQQTYSNWEMLIVDNYSSDGSRDVVRHYSMKDSRIRLIELPENSGGPARPRNVGIREARGEYIAFLDADDIWLPHKLGKQIDIFKKTPDVDLICTLANAIDENDKHVGTIGKGKLNKLLEYVFKKNRLILFTNDIILSSVIIKKKYLDKISFDEDIYLASVEDWKLWMFFIRKVRNFNIYNMREHLIDYRVVQGSLGMRNTDNYERKAIYLFSKLFLNKEISLTQFILLTIYFLLKIMLYVKIRKIYVIPFLILKLNIVRLL